MVKRILYLNAIRSFINKPVIKAITGIRRCGKSTFMLQIIEELFKLDIKEEQIININKELLAFDFIKNYNDLHHYIKSKATGKHKMYYVFVDEIQEITEWERAINSLLAEKKYDIYISGSNARLLASELASLLSGRYIEFKMFTLTFSEFLELYNTNQKQSNVSDVFEIFLKFGGFPGLHSMGWEENNTRQYLQSIYSTIVLKDLVMRYQVRDVVMLDYILKFLADNCGNITTAKSISDFVKSQNRIVSADTVQNYIHFAMFALIIHQIRRYDLNGKKILETFEKYYMNDIGLRYAMIGYTPSLISGQLENIVLLELLSRGYTVTIGKNKNLEIDFIAQKANEKIYIQVCTTLFDSKVIDREYGAFSGVKDHFSKLVLSLDNGFETTRDGIRWMNIKDFLLTPYSKLNT